MTNEFYSGRNERARTSKRRVDQRHSSGASSESDMDLEGGPRTPPDSLEAIGGISTSLLTSKSVANSEIKSCQ